MAERPVFVPAQEEPGFVKELIFTIKWASGFAPVQKKKNVKALHKAAEIEGLSPLLEISTKSEVVAGRHLSAFHLKIESEVGLIPLECAFQGSKVFENGGPFKELYLADPREAKRDSRLAASGKLVRFEFDGTNFPLDPKTAFYDWLYLKAVYPHRQWLHDRIASTVRYAGFTDIEFNPAKSINCQARSCALFVALFEDGRLDTALESSDTFLYTMKQHATRPMTHFANPQQIPDQQLTF